MHKPRLTQIYEFGDFRLDKARRLLLAGDGLTRSLAPKAFSTLLYMVEHSDVLLDKDALMKAVWPDTVVEENNLNQNISLLLPIPLSPPQDPPHTLTLPHP